MSANRYRMFVNGEWVEAADGRRLDVVNPATGDIIATVPDAGVEDARAAIAAAHDTFPAWAGTPADERARYMRKLYEAIMDNVDRLAHLLTLEQGKSVSEAKGEVAIGAEYILWYAEEARRIYGETIPSSSPASRIWVLRHPVGVVAAITPWNFPSAMLTRKIAPAMAAGCPIVVKPAEQTPLSAVVLGELFHEIGLPNGVINIVTSSRAVEIGNEFLENPLVRKISFTGSTEVGKHLLRGAASQVKRVSMELGGHAPFIVFEDANLDTAVQAAVGGKFRNAGQSCICANRIYVHESVVEPFLERYVEAVRGLRVGIGFDPGVQVGPLIDQAALNKVEAHVADAVAKQARVLTGGQRLTESGLDRGFFYEPTVLADATDDMQIMREETFGPVVPVASFRTDEEVLERANRTSYGLAAYIFTRNMARTIRMSEGLEYGMVGVNNASLATPQAPFGGIKESGIGREGGHHGLEGYLEYKYVSVLLDD